NVGRVATRGARIALPALRILEFKGLQPVGRAVTMYQMVFGQSRLNAPPMTQNHYPVRRFLHTSIAALLLLIVLPNLGGGGLAQVSFRTRVVEAEEQRPLAALVLCDLLQDQVIEPQLPSDATSLSQPPTLFANEPNAPDDSGAGSGTLPAESTWSSSSGPS